MRYVSIDILYFRFCGSNVDGLVSLDWLPMWKTSCFVQRSIVHVVGVSAYFDQ